MDTASMLGVECVIVLMMDGSTTAINECMSMLKMPKQAGVPATTDLLMAIVMSMGGKLHIDIHGGVDIITFEVLVNTRDLECKLHTFPRTRHLQYMKASNMQDVLRKFPCITNFTRRNILTPKDFEQISRMLSRCVTIEYS